MNYIIVTGDNNVEIQEFVGPGDYFIPHSKGGSIKIDGEFVRLNRGDRISRDPAGNFQLNAPEAA